MNAAVSRLLARVTHHRVEWGEVEQLADATAEPRLIELASVIQTLMLHAAEHAQDLQAADEDDDWVVEGAVGA